MRKLLSIMAAGLLLSACGNSDDADAAAGYCECFDAAEAIKEKRANATTMDEIIEMGETMADDIAASNQCLLDWQAKYKGKFSEDGFEEELNKISPEAYEDAKAVGAI
jgi:hypothetical protein